MIKSLRSLGTYDGSDVGADTRPVSSRNTNETLRRTMSSLTTQKGYKTRVVDIWALGITIVIGGQYFNWNDGLSAGFGSYAIATLLIGTAYICLCFCTSELSSALPFAGERMICIRFLLSMKSNFLTYMITMISLQYRGWIWACPSYSWFLCRFHGWMLRNHGVHNLYSRHLLVVKRLDCTSSWHG